MRLSLAQASPRRNCLRCSRSPHRSQAPLTVYCFILDRLVRVELVMAGGIGLPVADVAVELGARRRPGRGA